MASTQAGPLAGAHEKIGATFADFGGWSMPLHYSGGGIVREHHAVRRAVGLGDVSHLGKVRMRGAGVTEFLDSCLTNTVAKLADGQAHYTLCCAEDGGTIDDLLAYRVSADEMLLVPNAANAATVYTALKDQAPDYLEVIDEHRAWAVLAVQGPQSPQVLTALRLPTDMDYLSFVTVPHKDSAIMVCRTGYTGERGYELMVPWAHVDAVWDQALAATLEAEGLPVGLGARDTLRTEMGYPLHGHELSLQISPVQARLGWAIGWDKPQFWGREALQAQRSTPPPHRLVGLRALQPGVLRAELPVLLDGIEVGHATSGTFSPSLKAGIALALVTDEANYGAEVQVDVRGRLVACEVVKPPFVPSHVR